MKPKVTLIDRDEAEREELRRELEAAGYDVQTAAGLEEGEAVYRSDAGEAIVCDLSSADHPGAGVLKELHEEFPHMKLVALETPDRELPFEFSGAKVVLKPAEKGAVAAAVRQVLGDRP